MWYHVHMKHVRIEMRPDGMAGKPGIMGTRMLDDIRAARSFAADRIRNAAAVFS
jgi:uncharacterized protein (DUF433 family)